MRLKKSIFLTWSISYIIMLILPVIAGWVLYAYTLGVVREEVTRSNRIVVQNMQKNTDNMLYEVDRLNTQIGMNPRIGALSAADVPMTNYGLYDVKEVIRDLKVYQTANNYVKSFFIYLQAPDYIITPSVGRDSSDYFLNYCGMNADEMNHMRNLISQASGLKVYSATTHGPGGDKEVLQFIQTLPIGERSVTGAVVVEIEKSQILATATQDQDAALGDTYIVDRSNNFVHVNAREDINASELLSDQEFTKKIINGKTMYIVQTQSINTGWKYISAISDDVFLERIRKPQQIAVSILLLYILIACGAGFFLLKYNYRPLNKLLTNIEDTTGSGFDRNTNEYSFIEHTVTQMYQQNQEINKYLKQQKNVLRTNFLQRLLKGGLRSNLPLEETLKSFHIDMVSNDIVVGVFYINDLSGLFADDDSLSGEKRAELAGMILSNVMEELLCRENSAFVTELDDLTAFGIIPREENKPIIFEQIRKAAQEGRAFIKEHFHFTFTTSLSDIHDISSGADEAWQEALTGMEYKMVDEDATLIQYADLKTAPSSGYYYPIEKERQLINLIRLGKKEDAGHLLDEIFEANFERGFMTMQLVKCLMFDMSCTMIKTFQEVFGDNQDEFLEQLAPVERITGCDNVADLKKTVQDVLSTVCDYVLHKGNNKLQDRVKSFVGENYSNINLSVSSIAAHLNMHPSYVSTCFKEQTGTGLLDYIMQVRTEKAKALLMRTNRGLEEIAGAVGYTNSRTFSRVFRKIEGVTPSKYRDIYKDIQNIEDQH